MTNVFERSGGCLRASCYPHDTIGWYEPQTGGGIDYPSYKARAAGFGLQGLLAALGRVGACDTAAGERLLSF